MAPIPHPAHGAAALASPPAARGGRDAPVPDLTVVVLTWQARTFVDDCLAAIPAAAAGLVAEVVVVDNASPDGTADHVRATWPEVTVVRSGRNVGFSRGNNLGLSVAAGRHVVLLNPDAVPAPGALAALVRFADAHPGAGVVAPRLLDPDGADQGTARAFPTPAAALLGRRSPLTRWWPSNPWSRRYLSGREHPGDRPFRCDWVSGACLLVPRGVLGVVGPLDPAFFLYWEDADWCRRIGQAGYDVVTVPDAVVVHDEGVRRGWSARHVALFHRSAYRYYAKHHLRGPRRALRPLAAALLALRALGSAAVHATRAT